MLIRLYLYKNIKYRAIIETRCRWKAVGGHNTQRVGSAGGATADGRLTPSAATGRRLAIGAQR